MLHIKVLACCYSFVLLVTCFDFLVNEQSIVRYTDRNFPVLPFVFIDHNGFEPVLLLITSETDFC